MKNFTLNLLWMCILAVQLIKCDDIDCESEKDCDLCLLISECSWCVENNNCITKKGWIEAGCTNIILDNSTQIEINANFTNKDNMNKSPVQLNLKKATITITSNASRNISFEYRPTKFNPTDFYILMDASESIPRVFPPFLIDGQHLSGFRYGYGTFLREPLLNDTLGLNCEQIECEYPSYTFSHNLDFTSNISKLQSNINKTVRMASQNTSRFGMKVVDQILMSRDIIKWNITSRKFIVVVTDGYLNPFGESDGKSHERKSILENGKYNQNSNTPLEQILKDIFTEKFKIIFAVTDNVKSEYDKIQIRFPRNIFVAELWKNNSNIQNVIMSGYDHFTSSFGFEDDSDECTNLSYYSDCGNSTSSNIDRSICENVEYGKIYKYTVKIECNCAKCDNKEINITESTFGIDKINLNIDTDDLSQCSLCPDESIEDVEDDYIDEDANCRDLGMLNVCSGLGKCIDGNCSCSEGYVGQYCEFQICPTDRNNGLICGGPSRGTCDEGACVCEGDWEGEDCSNSSSGALIENIEDDHTDPINLTNRNNELICDGSSRGTCEAGTCVCEDNREDDLSDSGSGEFIENIEDDYKDEDEKCKDFGMTQVCSGLGECIDGNCSCNEGYVGQYCEFPICPSNSKNGLICGGPSRGTCEEGICVCEENWEGKDCSNSSPDESIEDVEDDYIDEDANCRDHEMTDVCSGLGECINGNCSCSEGYVGQYCEYTTCPSNSKNGLICGGPSRGTCEEGTCVCEGNWEGEDCSYYSPHKDDEGENPEEDEKCKDIGITKVCSGLGECIDGNCSCNEGYVGQYCEYPICPSNINNGMICSGPSRGKCDGGKCVCEDDWEGEDCSQISIIACSKLESCIQCNNTYGKCEDACPLKIGKITYLNMHSENITGESSILCESNRSEMPSVSFAFTIQDGGDIVNLWIYSHESVFKRIFQKFFAFWLMLFLLFLMVLVVFIYIKRKQAAIRYERVKVKECVINLA